MSGDNFLNSKNKKNSALLFLLFPEMELSSLRLKNFLYFRRELAKPKKQRFHIFCLLRENFSNISAKEKRFLYFPYKEAKFSKLKYFLIIIVNHFFSFYDTFFHTQLVYFSHLL